ncbi:MAG: hypothetical protein QNK23_10120 [Crocinitomicaceae bacterium]|nr:hypothetical protein [Crocinitomicaceae bacterium]
MIRQSLTNARHVVETDKILCCILPEDVFYSYNKPGTLCTVEDLQLIFEQYEIHAENGPLKIIAEMGEHSQMDKKSREYLQNHKIDAICEAAIIHNLAQRILINFYHKLKSHSHPSKVFKSFDNSLKWVHSMN